MTAAATERPPLRYERPWLYPKQQAALFAPERYSIVEASTKSGKTVGCLAWLFEQCALHGKAGRNYWWVAPTLPVAKIAFRRMKRAVPRTLYKVNETECTITLVNNATMWFKGADRPDLLYGEDVYGVVIDEASRSKEDAWTAIRSTLTATKGQARIIGNVRGKHNWAYRLARLAEQGAPNMAYHRLTAHDAIDAGIFDDDELADAKRTMTPEAFQELYFAEAADDGSNPFGWDAIQACTVPLELWEADLEALPLPATCWGWDFARAQDFTVGVALDKHYRVVNWKRFQRPWMETKADVSRETGPTPAWGDSTGVGDSVVEDLQRSGCPMIGVPFSAPMKQQLMERLRAALQLRKLKIPEGQITQELESFEYTYIGGDQGRVRYQAGEGLHDDCVMALALAVFGRDQFGEIPEPVKEGWVEHRHPGFDFENKKRRDPWEPKEPVIERKWLPNPKEVPLGW